MTNVRRPRVRSRTHVLSKWPDSELVCLRSDLRADPTLGGNMRALTGYGWLASVNAVLQMRGAAETTEPLF